MTPDERFWPKVQKGDGCWLWLGGKYGNGYGWFRFNGKGHPAHRVAWVLTHGAIPTGMLVCHRCDTPLCVNPAHLFLGSQSDNRKDCIVKGRAFLSTEACSRVWRAKTHCPQGHPYSGDNLYTDSRGSRSCRTCLKAAHQRRMERARKEAVL